MRPVRFVSLFVALSAVATASNNTLPLSVSDDVKNAIEKADTALGTGERQLALALYEGSLYPDGIKLAVDDSTVTSDSQFRGVSQALDIWRAELQGDFPVELVYDVKQADVVVKFVDTIDDRGTDTLGLIKLQKSFRWSSVKREITYRGTISIVRSAPGGRLTQAEVRDVAMHEIGHLLGLADTSRHGVLMGPLERGKPLNKPTQQETEDVKAIRKVLRQKLQSAGS
jgi:hypothetical protein